MSSKVVVFDWGGVIECASLANGEHFKFWIDIANKVNPKLSDDVVKGRIEVAYGEGGYIYNAEKFSDSTSVRRFIEGMLRVFEITPDDYTVSLFEMCYKEVGDKVRYRKDIVDYIHSLKDRCKIGLLSNLNALDKERQDVQVRRSEFDYVWLSCDMHMRKPDIDLFMKVHNQMHIPVEDVLFVDDNPNNIEAAKKIGWRTFLFTDQNLYALRDVVNNFIEG